MGIIITLRECKRSAVFPTRTFVRPVRNEDVSDASGCSVVEVPLVSVAAGCPASVDAPTATCDQLMFDGPDDAFFTEVFDGDGISSRFRPRQRGSAASQAGAITRQGSIGPIGQ